MKKILTLFSAIAMASLSAFATTFTFTSQEDANQTVDGITVTLSKDTGNNDPFFSNGGEMRLYANNTITVSGANITNISITFAKQSSKDYATLSVSQGTLVSGGESTSSTNYVTDTWTGQTSSVTFTLGTKGQRIIKQLVVNGDGSEEIPSDPSDPGIPDTPSELDPDFVYMEPTLLLPPAITVQGDAYSFIYSNVQVSCTKGAVNDSYFSAHAGYELTFTAAKPIKGLVINGFVKKGFTASVDHGSVSYLTPDEDTDAEPVVVITDIDSKSVKLSCEKQLRCYEVQLYFDANPDVTVSGGNSGEGEVINLTYDSAEAIYEKEFSDEIGEISYTVFLYNIDEPVVNYVALDIYPEAVDELEGTYSISDMTLGDYFTYYCYGEGEEDATWPLDGEVTITKKENIYTISGFLLCDNGKTYNFSFSGEMPIYLDEDYYGDGDDSIVTEITDETSENAPMYDLLGRKVGKSYRGIFIQNGKKKVAF